MSRGQAILLTLGTTAAIFIAYFAVQARAPVSLPERQPVFPGLLQELNDIDRVEVRQGAEQVTLGKDDNTWRIRSSGDYPADYSKVRNVLLSLSQVELLEYKTENPEKYAKLGVEDPGAENSQSIGFKAFAGEEPLVELIIGREREGQNQRFYARRVANPHALLVAGVLRPSASSRDWLQSLVLDISKQRISEVTFQPRSDREWSMRRDDPDQDFVLLPLAENQEPRSQSLLNQIAAALEQTHVDNSMQAPSFKFGPESASISYRTFDGLHIQVTTERRANLAYAAFHIQYEGPSEEEAAATEPGAEEATMEDQGETVRAEARRLEKSLAPWVFEIPLFKHLNFARDLDSLVKEKQAENATTPETENFPETGAGHFPETGAEPPPSPVHEPVVSE